jgi:hypothetical protein
MIKSNKPVTEQPDIIEICDLTTTVFAQAAVLIKQGYRFSKTVPPQLFLSGQAAITLELAEPEAAAIAGAAVVLAQALSRQKAREQKDELEAQQRTREHEERVAKQAQIAAEIEAAKAHLKSLEQAHLSA